MTFVSGCSWVSGSWSTYTTVSTVCATALLGGLVDLDVLDNEVASVETLGIGVGLGVLEETEEELGGLDGPAGAGDTKLLACCPMNQHSPAYPSKNRRRGFVHSSCMPSQRLHAMKL